MRQVGALSQLHTGADEGSRTVQQRANVPGYRCSHVERRRSARRHELGCDGDGKTSLKAFFGVFGDTMGADFASTYNPNAEVTTRYRWTGPCVVTAHKNVSFNLPNTSCDYLPGSVDLEHGARRERLASARPAGRTVS